MKFLRKYKWVLHGSVLLVFIIALVYVAVMHEESQWAGNALQTFGTISGIYLTLIIFGYSKEDSDKQFREQLEHLQELNAKQIQALYAATEKQITALHASTEKQITVLQETNAAQIAALQENTKNQIAAFQRFTDAQIDALTQSTREEISSFERQMTDVANKLTDNSILLAEILGRELEKSIEVYGNAVKNEEARYKDLSGWKFLRSEAEKNQQLRTQWERIQRIKQGYDYLVEKYNQVKKFLGIGQRKLNS